MVYFPIKMIMEVRNNMESRLKDLKERREAFIEICQQLPDNDEIDLVINQLVLAIQDPILTVYDDLIRYEERRLKNGK